MHFKLISKNNFQNLSDVFATGTVNSTFLSVTVIDMGQPPKPLAPFPIKTRGPSPAPIRVHPETHHRLRQGASDGLEESLTSQGTTECRSNQAQKPAAENWWGIHWDSVICFSVFLEKCLINHFFGAGIWIYMIFTYGTHVYIYIYVIIYMILVFIHAIWKVMC